MENKFIFELKSENVYSINGEEFTNEQFAKYINDLWNYSQNLKKQVRELENDVHQPELCEEEKLGLRQQLDEMTKINRQLLARLQEELGKPNEQGHSYPHHWGGYEGPDSLKRLFNTEKRPAEAKYTPLSKNSESFISSLVSPPREKTIKDDISWEQAASDLALRVAKLEEMLKHRD